MHMLMNGNKVQPPLPSSISSMASVCLSTELGGKFLLFNFFFKFAFINFS